MNLRAFTLIEVIVVLILMMIFTGIAYKSYEIIRLKAKTSDIYYSNQEESHYFKSNLKRDMFRCMSFEVFENKLQFQFQNDSTVVYTIHENQVVKTINNVEVMNFQISLKIDDFEVIQNVQEINNANSLSILIRPDTIIPVVFQKSYTSSELLELID